MIGKNFKVSAAYTIGLVLITLNSAVCFAADKIGTYTVFGEGTMACSKFLSAYAIADFKSESDRSITWRGSDFSGFLGFFQGYATRVNQTVAGSKNWYGEDVVAAVGWVASWCRDNPNNHFVEAVSQYTDSVLRKRKYSGRE